MVKIQAIVRNVVPNTQSINEAYFKPQINYKNKKE